jgi:hypothetical protein
MATLTSTLTLTGSATDFGDALALSVSSNFTFTHTNGIARKKITSTAIGTASGQVVIDTADEYASPSIIYVRNTAAFASDGTGTIYCYFDSDGTDSHEIQIPGGMFAFIPASSDTTLKAYTSTSGTIIEFMVLGTQA